MDIADKPRLPRAALPFMAFSFMEGLAPIYPVYMIMFAERGYGHAMLASLLAIWCFPAVLLELPSGILADRWSKRGSMAIGMCLKCLAFITWLAWPAYAGAALGFILWGAQEAFCSGARQALLYEALERAGSVAAYESAAGFCGAANTSATVLSLLSGGFLYGMSPTLVLALSALPALAGAGLALSLKEVRRSAGGGETGSAGLRGILESLRASLGARGLPALLAAACLAGAVYGMVDEYDGMWAREGFGLPLGWVGIWGALRFGLQGLGDALAAGISRFLRGGRMVMALIMAGVGLGASVFLPGFWGLPLYASFYLVMAALTVIFEARLQEAALDESRASLLSFSSLAMTLSAMGLMPILGLAGEWGGIRMVLAACGVTALLAAPLLITSRRVEGGPASPGRPTRSGPDRA